MLILNYNKKRNKNKHKNKKTKVHKSDREILNSSKRTRLW